jgi:hypothetical protein
MKAALLMLLSVAAADPVLAASTRASQMDRSSISCETVRLMSARSAWKTFDANAASYDADQVKKERSLYM